MFDRPRKGARYTVATAARTESERVAGRPERLARCTAVAAVVVAAASSGQLFFLWFVKINSSRKARNQNPNQTIRSSLALLLSTLSNTSLGLVIAAAVYIPKAI